MMPRRHPAGVRELGKTRRAARQRPEICHARWGRNARCRTPVRMARGTADGSRSRRFEGCCATFETRPANNLARDRARLRSRCTACRSASARFCADTISRASQPMSFKRRSVSRNASSIATGAPALPRCMAVSLAPSQLPRLRLPTFQPSFPLPLESPFAKRKSHSAP